MRVACTASAWDRPTTTAVSSRWPNARSRLPGARPSATPTRFTRAEVTCSHEVTGGTAAPIRSIALDDLTSAGDISGSRTPSRANWPDQYALSVSVRRCYAASQGDSDAHCGFGDFGDGDGFGSRAGPGADL